MIEIILTIIGSVMTILLAVIGFFLKDAFKLLRSVQESVNNLVSTIATIKEWMRSSEHMDSTVGERLKVHGERLDCHEKQLTRLETILKQ